MTSIIPFRQAVPPLDMRALARLLEATEPDLWVEGPLPGEDLEETVARREAARDIADEFLAEFGREHQDDDPAPAAAYVTGWAA